MLVLKNTKKIGRGLFAEKDIPTNTLIEVSPLIIIEKKKDVKMIMKTILGSYVYSYKQDSQLAIAGELGSFFNHNEDNNTRWVLDENKHIAKFYTTKNVKKGEQLFLNYGYEP